MRYFSQNDPAWKREFLGQSKCTVGQFGCTTSVIGTAGTYFSQEITPYYLSKRLRYTKDGLILWQSIGEVYKTMKFQWRFYTHDEKRITEGLKDPDTCVLLNVDRGYHWVLALYKIPMVGYWCSDPYPYPAKKRLYRFSEVKGGTILERK